MMERTDDVALRLTSTWVNGETFWRADITDIEKLPRERLHGDLDEFKSTGFTKFPVVFKGVNNLPDKTAVDADINDLGYPLDIVDKPSIEYGLMIGKKYGHYLEIKFNKGKYTAIWDRKR